MQSTLPSLDPLLVNLDKAIALVAEFQGGYSGEFLSAQEFHTALVAAVEQLKQGDLSMIRLLWGWFAPTCQWDDFTNVDGEELGNEIFSQLIVLRDSL